jgi:5-methylcytosine-specific restriction endonuclease McrA
MASRPQIFRAHGERSQAQSAAAFEANRASARQRGYGARWDKVSAGFKRSHPLCLGCEAIGRITATAVTDHVEPHKGDMVTFWNSEAWQPACKWHHDVVKQVLERRYAAGQLGLADLWLNSGAAIRLSLELLP